MAEDDQVSYLKLWTYAGIFSVVALIAMGIVYPESILHISTFPPVAFLIGIFIWLTSIFLGFIEQPQPTLKYLGHLLMMIGIILWAMITTLIMTPAGQLMGFH